MARKFDMNELCELAGVPYDIHGKGQIVEADGEDGGGDRTDDSIKELRDTDYRDRDAFFKMVQILKGLASVADDDEKAKKYLSAVSDCLTTAAKQVLGERKLKEAEGEEDSTDKFKIMVKGGEPQNYTNVSTAIAALKDLLNTGTVPIVIIGKTDLEMARQFNKFVKRISGEGMLGK